MTTARATMRIVARGLTDRRFCRALLAGRLPLLSGDERAAASGIDAERLALFAGFITKVRHSDVFEHLPGTLALLRVHGAELATFRDYFLERDPKARGDTRAKVVAFLTHLDGVAATPRGRAMIGLRDVLIHERCLFEVRYQSEDAAYTPFTGPVRWTRLTRDPYAVIDAAARGLRISGRAIPRWWLYLVRRGDGELRTIEIDRDVAVMLSSIATGKPPSRLSGRRRVAIASHLLDAGVIRNAQEQP